MAEKANNRVERKHSLPSTPAILIASAPFVLALVAAAVLAFRNPEAIIGDTMVLSSRAAETSSANGLERPTFPETENSTSRGAGNLFISHWKDVVAHVVEPIRDVMELVESPIRLSQRSCDAGISEEVAHQATLDTPQEAILLDQELSEVNSAQGICAWAPADFAQSQTFQQLDSAVAPFVQHEIPLAFFVLDLRSGRSMSYNADEALYPASSIKAVLACMAYQSLGSQGELSSYAQSLVRSMLIESDNQSFISLIELVGSANFAQWLARFAPDAAGRIKPWWNYPDISARELASVWQEIYRFATSAEAGAAELAELLSQTNYSAIGNLLRDRYAVWAKAGWYVQDRYASSATNDAGIVFSDAGPYVMVVLSGAAENFAPLMPVIDALNAAHGELCGGTSELLFTEDTPIPLQ